MAFRLVWDKVADDEWQAGGHDTLFVILANFDDGPASFSLTYNGSSLGDFPSLISAQAFAQVQHG